jgi:hypothetical protein
VPDSSGSFPCICNTKIYFLVFIKLSSVPMTSLTENLLLFTDAVVSGALQPPDDYPDRNTRVCAEHREDLLSL